MVKFIIRFCVTPYSLQQDPRIVNNFHLKPLPSTTMIPVSIIPAGIVTMAVTAIAVMIGWKEPSYPAGLVDEMIRNRGANAAPVNKMTVIITGSTNGLGKMVAARLYEMGATVVIASRNASKCESTISEIKTKFPNSVGILEVGIIDTSDLRSVSEFARAFLKGHKELHALINNAGIHYVSTEGDPINHLNLPMKSAQGYDLAFATNYLGHFLLTELLLPTIAKTSSCGTILNVSSTYHFLGDGDMLLPQVIDNGEPLMPFAARSDINTIQHRMLAYGNNKLAQVLHAKELQRRLNASKIKVRTVSICPGWVDTGIIPDNIGGRFVASLAFKVNEGVLSTLCGLFNSGLQGGEFLGNSVNIWARQPKLFVVASSLGLRNQLGALCAGWILLFQKMTYGKCLVEPSSAESLKEGLAKELYDWSVSEVSAYLK